MDSEHKQTLNASEIGTYLFCPRAWGLAKRGLPSDNTQIMREGTSYHEKIGATDRRHRDVKSLLLIVILILAGLILALLLQKGVRQ